MRPDSPRRQGMRQAILTAAALAEGGPAAMLVDAGNALVIADERMGPHLEALTASSQLACAAGCHHCCSLDVAATFPELAHLAATIAATFSAEALAALRARLDARMAEDAAQPRDAAALARRACPLLVDSLCSAYEARPLACRGWNSRDAAPCAEAAERPEAVHFIPVHRVLRDTALELSRGIQDGVAEGGLDDTALDLPRALHALLQDGEAITNEWLDGRMLPALHCVRDPACVQGPGESDRNSDRAVG